MNSTYLIATSIGELFTMIVAVGGLLTAIWKRGQNEGRITEILSHLEVAQADHEARIRALEHGKLLSTFKN